MAFKKPPSTNFHLSLPGPPSYTSPQSMSPDPNVNSGRPLSTSPQGYFAPLQNRKGYFPRQTKQGYLYLSAPPTRQVSRDEALKTAKAVDEVLVAWREYRETAAAWARAGRKLAAALERLVAGLDRTDLPAQTLRPTAAMLGSLSEQTTAFSKNVDKAYDEAHASSSKYTTLLAKESKSHVAYLGAISKKHEKAGKAYRKASRNLSDTSEAHSGFSKLTETLGEDISRANADHAGWVGDQQAMVLLKIAGSAGSLAGDLLSFFSAGMRQSGTSYRDIEYFRVLADIQWQGSLPSEAVAEDQEKRREALRLVKAAVAVGEIDMIGQQVWQGLTGTTMEIPQTRSAEGQGRHDQTEASAAQIGTVLGPSDGGTDRVPVREDVAPVTSRSPMTPTALGGDSLIPQAKASRWAPDNRLENGPASDAKLVTGSPRPLPIPRFSSRSSLPGLERSVSQIAAELEARAEREREGVSNNHKSHRGIVKGCALCATSIPVPVRPFSDNPGQMRRVTMPPTYQSQQSRPASINSTDGASHLAYHPPDPSSPARQNWRDGESRAPSRDWNGQLRRSSHQSLVSVSAPRGEIMVGPRAARQDISGQKGQGD